MNIKETASFVTKNIWQGSIGNLFNLFTSNPAIAIPCLMNLLTYAASSPIGLANEADSLIENSTSLRCSGWEEPSVRQADDITKACFKNGANIQKMQILNGTNHWHHSFCSKIMDEFRTQNDNEFERILIYTAREELEDGNYNYTELSAVRENLIFNSHTCDFETISTVNITGEN